MGSLRNIDGNIEAYDRFEQQQARAEAESERRNELINWTTDGIQEAIKILRNPEDLQDLEDLAQIMDDAIEQLEDLVCRLEEAR